MGRAKLTISFALLKEVLELPEDTIIYGINMSPEDLSRTVFEVFVKHADLPAWHEGEAVVRVTPCYEKHSQHVVVFKGWEK